MQLTDDSEVEIKDSTSWLRYNNNPHRAKLFKLVEEYQYNNDKSKVREIVALIEGDSDIKALNAKYKKIKTLYRGIASDEHLETSDIVEEDRISKYVSTTPIERIAQRFAERIGHLDSKANSKHSYIVTYKCTPSAILFSTDIFGQVFGESDIVLDAAKAKATVHRTR